MGTEAFCSLAWFQASGKATLNPSALDTKDNTITAGSFTTALGSVDVTVSFEEITDVDSESNGLQAGVLGLCHYYSSANNETYGAIGWHQAYRTESGTTVWNAEATGGLANAYGVGATVYYRVYKIKAVTASLTPDQAQTLPTAHTIVGNVTVASDDDSMITWKQEEASAGVSPINVNGTSSAPSGTFDNSEKSFTAIDFTGHWNEGVNTVYSTTYFAISCDGAIHTSGNVTGTLAFDDVAAA